MGLMLSMMMCGLTSLWAFAATTIDVTSLGVVANDISAASSNASKLKSSMSSCSDGTTYYFPNGTYYIAPSSSWLSSSGMVLSGKNNITLEGDNATIVNTSYDNTSKSQQSGTFMVKASNCTNLTIKGLNFDYQDYTSVSGTITATAGDSITIQLDDKFLDGSYKNALTGGEFIQCLNQLDDNGTPVCEHFTTNTSTGFTGTLSGNKYTITGNGGGSWYYFSVGKTLVVRFSLGTGAVPAFQLTSVKGLTVEDVNVYSTPADVFYCTGSNSDYSFTRLNIGPKEDAPTYWGSNVDGIHLLGISGEITIDNCSFKGMGDDALNSHSRAAKVTATGTNSATIVDGWSSGSLESTWGSAGDVVRFYKDDWTLLGTATISSFSGTSLKVDSLPSGVTSGCFVQNTKFMPKITIKDTVVDGSRARAFLIRSEDVSITGCTVKNTRLAAVIMAADISTWFEMGPSANVTIDNNLFQNCCVSKVNSNYGVVAIKGCDDGGGDNYAAGVHNNITITNNVFNGSGASSIYASATDGLTIKGNTFANYGRDPHEWASTTGSYAVAVVNCNNVTMDYDDSLYSRNASITQVEPEGGDNGGGEEGGEISGLYDDELKAIVINNYDSKVAFDNNGTVTEAVNWTNLTSNTVNFNNWSGKNNRANTGMAVEFNVQNKNEFVLADGFAFQMATSFNPNATTFTGSEHYFKFGDVKLAVNSGRNAAGSALNSGIYIYNGDTLVASADTGYAANDATFKSYYTATYTYYYVTYTDGKMSLQTINSNGTHNAVWTLADGTENVTAVPVEIGLDDNTIEVYKFGGWGQYDSGDTTVICDPALSTIFPYSTVADFAAYLSALDSNSSAAEVAHARYLYDGVAAVASSGLKAEIAPYESYIIACEEGGDSGEGGDNGGGENGGEEGGEEGGDDIEEPSALDEELASIVVNEYDSLVGFDNTGTESEALNWNVLASAGDQKFANWGGLNNRVQTNMNADIKLQSKNDFDFTDGFKFQMATTFNPDATLFNSTGHYFMFGDLKLLIDCGQNLAGSRTAGVYIYDGDTLVASADTGIAANDATFKSHYTAKNTYYYITYTGGKMSVQTVNSNGTYDVVWTLADGTENVSAVPITITEDDKRIEVFKFGGWAQNQAGNIVLCDPALSGTFPYSTVDAFTTYLSGLDSDSTEEQVTRARTLFDKVKETGSLELVAEVEPYESYIIACENAGGGEGGDNGEGGGESGGENGGEEGGDDVTDTTDSGNMPSSFFTADKWSTDEKRLVFEMSDGSIKFDDAASASVGNYINSGFTTQFKAVGGWEIELRNTSASTNNGYVLGYIQKKYAAEDDSRVLYIRKNGSDVQLARAVASHVGFTENEWHTLGVYFDDETGKTTIRVYIDGVQVKFGAGYTHDYPDSFVNNAIENGNFVDFDPIQRGNYFKINPYFADAISGYGSMSFRSIDATETDHLYTIAAVGDSITQGACATGRGYSYPAELQRLLGTDKFNVVNFGHSGATLMSNTGAPYNIQKAYYRSLSFAADYTVIMLGTNDSVDNYWDMEWSSYADYDHSSTAKFEADLRALIADYTAVGTKVIIMTSPASHNQYYTNIDAIVAIQKAVAADLGLDVIDMNAFTTAYGDDWQQYYDEEDGLHFNDAGYAKAAEYVAEYFETLAAKADTAVTTPDESAEIALDKDVTIPYSATISEGDFAGFCYWYSNNTMTMLIGASGAEAWAYTNGRFDLGKNFNVSVTVENNVNPSSTYSADGDFSGLKYSSLSVGALEMRIRPLKNSSGVKSFLYDLYMNGVKIGSSFVDSGNTAPSAQLTYNIRFINGYIAVTRSDDVSIMTVTPETYNAVRNTADYTFDDARIGFGTFELGAYHRVASISAESFADTNVEYSITATEGGKIMEDDTEFDGTKDYLVGETVTLTAVADDSHLFVGWINGDGELLSKDAEYTVIFEPDTEIVAKFIEKQISGMVISATVGGKITENGADFVMGDRLVSTSATIRAAASQDGYKFAYWELNGVIVSRDAEYTITFTEEGTLTAVFATPLDQEMLDAMVTVESGYDAADWTVTGDGAYISDGKIYAGNKNKANSINAVYNTVLNLSSGFSFSTKFTWAYGIDTVNYWANNSMFHFGDLKFEIVNAAGSGTKTPVIYKLYNGDAVIATYDTGYYATNGQYSTAIEEYLNSTFTITYDGTAVKVFSSSLDANNDGTAGEYIVWTVSDTETNEAVTVGNIDLTEATIKLEKNWGGSNFTVVEYFADLEIKGGLPFATVAEFNAFLNELNNEYDAATVALAREYYDAVSDEIKAQLDAAPALFAAEAALNGETIDAVYEITAENGAVYVGNKLLDDAGVQYGETVILSAVETGDKGFTGWYDSEGNLITAENDIEVKFINTVRLTALFDSEVAEKEDSAMTVIATEGGKITENGEDYVAEGNKVGDKAILTAVVTDSAYQFGYWLLNGDIVSYNATYTLTYEAEGELIAVFTEYASDVISGYVAEDWTLTPFDGKDAQPSIKNGAIYAGNGATHNQFYATYNKTLNLSSGFTFSTKFTWAYSNTNGYNNGDVNYWGDKSIFYFGDLKLQIKNSNGNSKTPIIFTLYNGDAVIGTYDTGFIAANYSGYNAAIEEYLNATFTITYDGSTVKVFSSSLDANNDGVAGEYIVWTVSGTETTEAVTVGSIDLSDATIKLEKGWGGANHKNVEYFADLVIETPASHTVSVVGRQGNTTSMQVANGTEIVLSNVIPFTYGYKVVGWTDGEGRNILTDNVIVTEETTLKPVFEVADDYKGYVVNVSGASNTEGGIYEYNEKITLEFDSSVLVEGEYFGGWINAATNAVISYEENYTFYVGADTTITAFIASEEAVSTPVVAITDVCDMNGDGSRWSFLMERTVPETYEYVGSGFVYSTTEFVSPGDAPYKKVAQSATANGQFRLTINLTKATDVYMLAYLTYADAEGNEITIYSNGGTPVHCQKG